MNSKAASFLADAVALADVKGTELRPYEAERRERGGSRRSRATRGVPTWYREEDDMSDSAHRSWRLLPSEEVLWEGRAVSRAKPERAWFWVPWLCFAVAAVSSLFAALLWINGVAAMHSVAFVALYFLAAGVAIQLAPAYLRRPCEYLVTDRRVLWRRGRMRRSMDRHAITYARIRWNHRLADVGHVELVRAVPFGPLSRRQRITFHDVECPDAVLARIRGKEPSSRLGDGTVGLTDRLDPDERVLWGGHPEGWLLGWSDLAVAVFGGGMAVFSVVYALRVGGLLLDLEQHGLRVGSSNWLLLFSAIVIAFVAMASVGAAMLWHGLWGARAQGRATEYVLTDRRLLIRRGRTELSVDRCRIVDVADVPGPGGLHHLFLLLDGPQGRALEDSGALGHFAPLRSVVPPVLFELRDPNLVRGLLLADRPRPLSLSQWRDAA